MEVLTKGRLLIAVSLVVFTSLMLVLAACGRGPAGPKGATGDTGPAGVAGPAGAPGPVGPQGEKAEAISANIRALHDSSSPQFDGDCLSCHRDVTQRTTLDPNIQNAHIAMFPFVPGYSATQGPSNETCNFCHKGVDFAGHSTAGIRKEVDVQTCVQCHGPAGPGKQFYIK